MATNRPSADDCNGGARVHIDLAHSGAEVHVVVHGEIDLASVGLLADALVRALAMRARTVVVDAAGVSYLDSSALNCLVGAARHAAADGERLVVRNPTGIVRRVIEISGLDDMLFDQPNEDAAEPG